MRLMSPSSSRRLAALIDAHQAEHGSTQTAMAQRIGVTPKTLIGWRRDGLRGRLPERAILEAVADAVDVPYRVVLDAALHDTDYADQAQQPATAAGLHNEAVRALSAAARLSYQPRRRAPNGAWVVDGDAPPQRADWAAFVTSVVTAAAANAGGLDEALAGRPGSWEADVVRRIVESTAGPDALALLRDFRTEPIEISVDPESVLADAGSPYFRDVDAAEKELGQRAHGIRPAIVYIPPESPVKDELRAMYEEQGVEVIVGTPPDWDQDAEPVDLTAEEAAEESALEAITNLEERLEAQTAAEITDYGRRLAGAIREHVGTALDHRVPVIVSVMSDSVVSYEPVFPYELEAVVDAAIAQTPTPDALLGTPLSRVENETPA